MNTTSHVDRECRDGEQRIQWIPFSKQPRFIKPQPLTFLGMGLFLLAASGVFLPGLPAVAKQPEWILTLCLLGLGITLFSLWKSARHDRRHWPKVRARCLDWEYWKGDTRDGESGKTWYLQLLCEFEFGGTPYRVTPAHWTTYATRKGVQRFLNKIISPEQTCDLWINPKNPLQAELISRDVKDLLLH